MHSDRIRQALFDIRDNALLAADFVGDMNVGAFAADRRTFYAVTRCLEIISEAARRLDDDIRARHSEIPWRAVWAAATSTAMIRRCGGNAGLAYRQGQPSRPPGRSRVGVTGRGKRLLGKQPFVMGGEF